MLFIRSKIQFFESKSQPVNSDGFQPFCCLSDQRYNFLKANHNTVLLVVMLASVVYQIKDTIFWKQITTSLKDNNVSDLLFIRSKIQFFESKSQLDGKPATNSACCLSDQRYNFLKANHNYQPGINAFKRVVYQIKDTIFWKQITTFTTPV